MSTLVLLRHGQASFGSKKYDALSELGVRQSEATGRFWAAQGQAFTHVWIGPRDRHRQTATAALAPLGLAVPDAVEQGLDEFADGTQILASAQARLGVHLVGDGAVTGRSRALHYANEITEWAEGRVVVDGVPTPEAFRATVGEWLARATSLPGTGQTILAVTSGGVIGAVLSLVLDLPTGLIGHFMKVTRNASITEILFSPGRRPALMSFNQVGHLAPDAHTLI
jgi:broad specificity phosphatase PhoE